MKKIIVSLIMMLCLVGCGYKSIYHFNSIQKIKSSDEKEVVEYVVNKIRSFVHHKIEVDYKTIKTYSVFEKTDNGFIEGKSIFVDCKIKDSNYFIEIKNFNNKPNYFVSIVEE